MPVLPTPIPHPLSYFDAPGWLREALEWVVGMDWPDGDEKAMRLLADEWHEAARQVGPLLDEADQAALAAVAAFGTSESGRALHAMWQRLGGGPEATLTVMNSFFDELGQLVGAGANEIEAVKLEFYIELALLLAELLILAATAPLTLGGSMAGAGPVMLATRFAIQQILKKATKELLERGVKRFALRALKEGLEEGAEELAASVAAQAYQIREGNRSGLDSRDMALSFGLGTAGGSVASLASIGGIKSGSWPGRFGEHGLRSAGGEILAEVTIGVVTGQGVSWTSLGMAATSGAAGTPIEVGQRMVDNTLVAKGVADIDFTLSEVPLATDGTVPLAPASTPPPGPPIDPATRQLEVGLDPTIAPGVPGPHEVTSPAPTDPALSTTTGLVTGPAPITTPEPATPSADAHQSTVASGQSQIPAPPAPRLPPPPPPPPAGGPPPQQDQPWLPLVAYAPPVAAQEISPGVRTLLEDNRFERQAYAEHVLGAIQFALRNRLLRLVDTLIERTDSDRRRRELREHNITALTPADIEPIAEQLWHIANSDMLDGVFQLAPGGVNDHGTVSRATGRDHPPAVELTRRYGSRGGYRPPLALHQQDVELAVPRDEHGVPQRFADLFGGWLQLINDGGPNADPSRAINCTDVVLSVLDTWLHGRPRVAAPRTIDKFTLDSAVRPLGGEPDGARRIEVATGGRFQQLPPDRPGFALLEAKLLAAGHGSCAVLIREDAYGTAHATTVHNQHGQILYVDAQQPGMPPVTDPPLSGVYTDVLVLDPSAMQIDLGTDLGRWSTFDESPNPEGAPTARSAPEIDPTVMLRDPGQPLGLMQLDPRELRFTQRSVSPATSFGVEAADLVRDMAENGWRGGPVHAVMWGDGTLATLDHRRLRAAVTAGLPQVPVMVHAPSEPISAWGEAGEALVDDLRRVPDGTWVVGGDEGESVYPKGTVPRTCGEAAIFRAATQRSLLPGHLFGTHHEPVILGRPPGPQATPDLDESIKFMLDDLRVNAEAAANTVQADLEALGYPLHGLENRIKTYESLARKYDDEEDRFQGDPQQFANNHANDVLRFTVELPDGVAYATALQDALDRLNSVGYQTTEVKNFWAPGNRYYGVNATLRSPDGQLFEIQFATQLSLRANAMTHELYKIVRREDELEPRRVHALMQMLAVNKQLDMQSAIPPGLAELHEPRDNGLPKWMTENTPQWDNYKVWLAENRRSLSSILTEFGLTGADFPISPKRAETLREQDRGILGALQ